MLENNFLNVLKLECVRGNILFIERINILQLSLP